MQAAREHLISASASIPAPPSRVYAVIADYRVGHPAILPEQFSGMTVESGGYGAGTIIRFNLRALGRTHTTRAAISEPQPGRVLVETELGGKGIVTTFTVDAGPVPGQSHVTFDTRIPVRAGLLGSIERLMSTRILVPIYKRELGLLADYVTGGHREDRARRAS